MQSHAWTTIKQNISSVSYLSMFLVDMQRHGWTWAYAIEQCEGCEAAEKEGEVHAPEPRATARDQGRIAGRSFESQDGGARRHGATAFPPARDKGKTNSSETDLA
jgi:hypothetical protein